MSGSIADAAFHSAGIDHDYVSVHTYTGNKFYGHVVLGREIAQLDGMYSKVQSTSALVLGHAHACLCAHVRMCARAHILCSNFEMPNLQSP